ncbi:probable methyltransferase-like protein 24 [Haliotis rufescens]|uniref:probable methyltransferase-like protein 24 n=1 Tax=Haliotis rufescens TaxID=6454 RepID=UPI00201EB8F1|nr:probable methyltransferase-like protein 24 [Haliotis rufescens]
MKLKIAPIGFMFGFGCGALFLIITQYRVTEQKAHLDASTRTQLKYRKSNWALHSEENMDGPLKDLRQQGQVRLPKKDVIEKMSISEAFKTYHSYLDNVDMLCKRKLRMGKLGDGGWEICDDAEYRPVKPCIVYSFGINNDFSFDDETAKNYECDVFSFDPSMKQKSYQRSPRVRFLSLGIDGKDYKKGPWNLHSLTSFKKMLNHTGRFIDVLKMDVEHSEWPALPNMISSGELSKVRQFLVEYHGKCDTKNDCRNKLKILKDIYDKGFRKFYVHKNHQCGFKNNLFPVIRTGCYEIHYVNINIQ